MKKLTKEIFNNLEIQCLITENRNQEVNKLTNKVVNQAVNDYPGVEEIYNKLTNEEIQTLNNAIKDNALEAILDAMLIGFKDGFNTAQDIHGSQCLI